MDCRTRFGPHFDPNPGRSKPFLLGRNYRSTIPRAASNSAQFLRSNNVPIRLLGRITTGRVTPNTTTIRKNSLSSWNWTGAVEFSNPTHPRGRVPRPKKRSMETPIPQDWSGVNGAKCSVLQFAPVGFAVRANGRIGNCDRSITIWRCKPSTKPSSTIRRSLIPLSFLIATAH